MPTRPAGIEASSLEALRASERTAWFRDNDSLWVKLVVEDPTPDGAVVVQVGNLKAQASVDVSRKAPRTVAALD